MSWKIKSGYRENLTRQTWEENSPGVYWNDERLRLSDEYQYDVYLYARSLAKRHSLKSVIDVGAGPGRKLENLLGDVADRLVMVDQTTVERLACMFCPKAEFIAADLEDVRIDLQEKFELLLCVDVLEHLIDPASCLAFIRKHANEGAWIVFSTPERDYLHGADCSICEKPEHVREWNSREFSAVLDEAGFDVVEHWLCPQIRPAGLRGNRDVSMLVPFLAESDPMIDALRACQIAVSRVRGRGVSDGDS